MKIVVPCAGQTIAYTIGPIFNHIIDCVQLYFNNGITNIVIKASIVWLVSVKLIFHGTLQIIVQRCQIAAPRWPDDICSAADNAIFKNRSQLRLCDT